MKIVSFAMSSLLLMACAGAASAAPAADPVTPAAQAEHHYRTKILSRADLDQLLAKPDSLVIVDVRRPDELTAKGGFPVYLSVQFKELKNSLAYIPKDRTVVTVSNHAGRALPAGDLLTDAGFHVAGAIGVEGYEKEGGTLTRIAVPAAKPNPEERK